MLVAIKELLVDLYDYEGSLVDAARDNGYKFIRPSSVLLILIMILYVVSPYDIISEALVKPKVMGYIDDLFLCIFICGYAYSDLKGVLDVSEQDKIQLEDDDVIEKSDRANKVFNSNESNDEHIDNISSIASNECSNRQEPEQNDYGNRNSIDDCIDSDIDDSEDSTSSDGEFGFDGKKRW